MTGPFARTGWEMDLPPRGEDKKSADLHRRRWPAYRFTAAVVDGSKPRKRAKRVDRQRAYQRWRMLSRVRRGRVASIPHSFRQLPGHRSSENRLLKEERPDRPNLR